jgi:hypothetical protein
MAGLGARLFPAFSKLTSAQVNGYLMDQTIMRFADAAARDAAFGGAGEPTLAEGMTCYLDSTNQIQSYNGTTWVTLLDSDSPPASQLLSTKTAVAGSTSFVFDSVFNADFNKYEVVLNTNGNGTAVFYELRMRNAGAVVGGSNYYANGIVMTSNSTTVAGTGSAAQAYFSLGSQQAGTNATWHKITIDNPFVAQVKGLHCLAGTYTGGFGYNYQTMGTLANGISCDGFQISIPSGTFSGTCSVYGIRQ